MKILLSDLLKRRGATLIMTPRMILRLLQESNEIGRMQGTVEDMMIYMDSEGNFQYSLIPKNPGQN